MPAQIGAADQQAERRRGEDHEIKVVGFPETRAWSVVALVKEPARPMHDPAMRAIGNALHRGDGGKEDEDAGQHVH